MGAINYGTSDYITLGYDLNAWNESDFSSYEEMEEEKYFDIGEMFSNVENLLENQNFYYFHIAIKYGYYEGFYLDIENNFSVAFDGWEDRREAQKEVTRIKAFLMACIDAGMIQVYPGWCPAYKTPEESKEAVNAAIKEMREEIKHIPTWRQYERGA